MKIELSNYRDEYESKIVPLPTAKEKGRSFTLDNQSAFLVKKWAIDKNIFKNKPEKRCDYLLLVERKQKPIYYWIELKGSDIIEACRQIRSTIENIYVEKDAILQARIITTRVYTFDLREKDYKKLEAIIGKSKGEIIVHNIHFTERI